MIEQIANSSRATAQPSVARKPSGFGPAPQKLLLDEFELDEGNGLLAS
jgi:hypothetical protein